MKKNYLEPKSEPLSSLILKNVCDAPVDPNVGSQGSGNKENNPRPGGAPIFRGV